jgi:protein required for attachment to host cells
MKRLCIALADASRARIFTFEELAGRTGGRTQEIQERISLVHPGRRRRPSELFSDTRPGSDRTPTGRGFGLSDHRDQAVREMDRQFAADIARHLREVVDSCGCRDVVLAASPRMLGLLREHTAPLVEAGIAVHDLDRDLVRFTPAQLQDFLAERGLLPERERLPAGA